MADNHINFVYKLEGNVQEVDVFKLAPTLLAIGELVQDSNRETNPGGRQIGINVKPFREGSFIVDLTVFPENHLQQLLDLISSPALLEWIGLILGTQIGAVQVIRFLKGKPKSVEEVKPGEFRYTSIDDRSVTISAPVHQLISNSSITNNIYRVYAAPMEQLPSVTDVVTYLENAPQTAVTVTREDVPIIKEYVTLSTEQAAPEKIEEHTHHGVYLNPKRGSFDGDPKDWSFWRGDEIITATIKDKEFIAQCRAGKYRLNYPDLLTVDLLERQRVVGTKVQKPSYEILRVTQYVEGEHGEEQAGLGIPPPLAG